MSEKFTHKLAMLIVGFSALVVLLLFFIEIPEANQRIVDMVLGVIIGSGFVAIISFYFGGYEPSDNTESNNKQDYNDFE